MPQKTKQKTINEMYLEAQKQDLVITCLEQSVKDKEESILDIKKIVSKQNDELNSLRIDKKEMQKSMNEWVLKQISRLEAVQMLWSIIAGAGTHREKTAFYHQALTVVQSEINDLKRGVNNNSDDLPF